MVKMFKTVALMLICWAFLTDFSHSMELIMFHQTGCVWCKKWDQDIGEVYPKTPEGQQAPLRRIDLLASKTAGLKILKPIIFTPTFVLMKGGEEIGRITGFAGEAFFLVAIEAAIG